MTRTEEQFTHVLKTCTDLFLKKMKDYGTAWRILRPSSMTDQIYIKAQRIRSIEEKGEQMIDEGVRSEYIGIVNYCAMAMIQLELGPSDTEMGFEETEKRFRENIERSKNLMLAKNHDYGEAWRNMRISSYTDLILMKLKRTKQIEDNDGATLVSEGIEANYMDMLNYSMFALIKLEYGEE